MRVDKYLWCLRYFKSRNMATNACKAGKVKIKNESVKPSREVFPGEKVQLRKEQVDYIFEILDLPQSRLAAKLVDLYRKDITPIENLEKLNLQKISGMQSRKKGTGRPTKKERRDIDDFTDV